MGLVGNPGPHFANADPDVAKLHWPSGVIALQADVAIVRAIGEGLSLRFLVVGVVEVGVDDPFAIPDRGDAPPANGHFHFVHSPSSLAMLRVGGTAPYSDPVEWTPAGLPASLRI